MTIVRIRMKLSIKEHIVLTHVLNLKQKKKWIMICASLQTETLTLIFDIQTNLGCSMRISIRAESVKWLQVVWFCCYSNCEEQLGKFIFLKDNFKGHRITVTSGTLLKIIPVWVISCPVRQSRINRIYILSVTLLIESIGLQVSSCRFQLSLVVKW